MAASTTRPRKTAAAKTAADTSSAEATQPAADSPAAPTEAADAPAAEARPKTPDAAPLEPPTIHAAPEPPAEPGYVSPTEVIPDDEHLADVILDDATKEPPADVDAVFQPVTPYGSTLMCTVRLVERTFLGPHRNPVERLLQPKGAHVSENVAARILERLVAQAATVEAEK
ncbi:hypothetical protein ABZV52_29700 [Streptomyces sp. NPDC004735]|uniref:hypothetical protein n=1 Tax=Streptomyces TaxID=1883 RepID=UPI0033B11655